MRIAIVNWNRRKVGGAETYLSDIIPELVRLDHSVAFWHEVDEPADREQIPLPDGMPAWCVSDLGATRALAALRDWHPDLIYAHGLHNLELEAETLHIAPVVFFAHAYHGTCISGAKTFKNPIVTPCSRRFGWQCLLHYYPHRCGGWSPVTMIKEYLRQAQRLKLLSSYRFILTMSEHMRQEYIRHDFAPEQVIKIAGYTPRTPSHSSQKERQELTVLASQSREDVGTTQKYTAHRSRDDGWRLLFLGRMDYLKGGHLFLDAIPLVSRALRKPLRITFAGDGPKRYAWERKAWKLLRQSSTLHIEFVGWVNTLQRESLFSKTDLLVLPSLWPEPYGLVGLEAGLHGVPVAAFRVGGISEWLIDGRNGHLASSTPPTASGLAHAIVGCLQSHALHRQLCRGTAEHAKEFSQEIHVAALEEVFMKILQPDPNLYELLKSGGTRQVMEQKP